jgi:hypothetical protein
MPVQGIRFCHGTSVRHFAFLINMSLMMVQILCHANIPAMPATMEVVDMFAHCKKRNLFHVSDFG